MFKFYGEEFLTHLRGNTYLMTGIQDYGINKSNESRILEPHVYFLFDVNGESKFGNYIDIKNARVNFTKNLLYFQQHESYVADYAFDSNLSGHLHVVVLKLPPQFTNKFNLFVEGKYSKMYTSEEIDKYFLKQVTQQEVVNGKVASVTRLTEAYCVLAKIPEYFPEFQARVKEEFGTTIEDDGREYDFPIYLPNEVLRFEHNLNLQSI